MRGKVAVGKVDKKTAAAKSRLKAPVGVNSPGHCAGNRSLGGEEVLPRCGGCEIIITNDVSALQCDRCVSLEGWKCSECLGLSGAAYAALFGCRELKWFCAGCESREGESGGGQRNVENTDGIKEVLRMVGMLFDKVSNMDDKLGNKVDAAEMASIEVRVMGKLSELVDRVARLEEGGGRAGLGIGMGAIETLSAPPSCTIKQDRLVDYGSRGPCNMIREDEEEDMERRRNCVIVHGVQESLASVPMERREDDVSRMKEVFHELGTDGVEIVKAFRLGKPSPGSEAGKERGEANLPRPRPLKLMLRTEEMKSSILRNAKNLMTVKEGAWKGIVIHQDFTPREREIRKGVLEELRKRIVAGERDLIMVRGRIVKKRMVHATGEEN